MGLTRTAINRPVFIFMLMLGAILMGFLSYNGMKKELNPDVSFGIVSVLTTYQGASPDEVNTLVTKKIEDAVSGVSGIREIDSTSQDGRSLVTINFNLDVNIDTAVNDVRSKVDAATPNLPKEVDKPIVSKVDTSSQPVLYLAFTADNLSSRDLRDLIDQKLSDRFAQVTGVGEVDVQGGDVREIQVQLSKDKLLAYGIGITDVQKALAKATENVPAGHLTTLDQQYNVRVFGEFQSVDDIRNARITISNPTNPQAKAASVRLADIADVVDTSQERTTFSRVNGKDAILVVIQKSKDGNTVDVVSGCKTVINNLLKEYKPAGLHIVVTQDQSTQITDSLKDVNFSLYFGIFLVASIVFIFLHNFRGMLIVAIAIPLCLFVTYILLKLSGFTINNLSLLALSLAIGVLVDDAIVIIENIYRHLELGEDPKEAALNGRAELGLAAMAITLADVVVFLPIGFAGGITGRFLQPLAFGYVFAVITSLLVSFTVTPMLASRWYRKGEDLEHPKGRFASAFERGFERLKVAYGRGLEWALKHRWFVFVLGNALLVAVFVALGSSNSPSLGAAISAGIKPMIFAAFIGVIAVVCNAIFYRRFKPMLPVYGLIFGLLFPMAAGIGYVARQWKGQDLFIFQFFPPSDTGSLSIEVQMPPGTNLTQTTNVVKQVESKISADPDVQYVNSSLGTTGFSSFSTGDQGPNYALIQVNLYDMASSAEQLHLAKPTQHVRTRSTSAVSADILQSIGRVPGALITVAPTSQFGGGSAIQLGFISDDRPLLVATVNKVMARLKTGVVPGLVNVDISSKPGTPEFRAIPNRTLLADAGITVDDLGTSMRILYQGDDNIKYRDNGNEYVIRTMMSYKDRNDPNVMSEVPIAFSQGNPIFVPSVATIQQATQLSKIDRLDRSEKIQVNADLLPSYANAAGTVQAQINALVEKEHLVPAGVTYRPLGQADFQQREGNGIVIAMFLGLILVYMLLASLFDNLLYPFIIQLAQPQAFVGALLALVITNTPLSIVGIVGLITLIGIVGKNAILLVDYTNTLRHRGHNRHDAIVEAGPTRLRPIVMTSSALFFGLLPVAMALGRGSEFRQSLGIIIIGGVTLSTILTLFVIPCSYTIFDDFSLGIGRLMARLQGRPAPPSEFTPEGTLPPSSSDFHN